MRRIWAYLKYRFFALLIYLTAVGLILLIGFLSGQPMTYCFYTALVLTFLVFSLCLFDERRYHNRLLDLQELNKQLVITEELLPRPEHDGERELLCCITALADELRRAENALRRLQTDSQAYYTLWAHQIKTPIAAMALVTQDMDDPRAILLRQELVKIEQYTDMAMRFARLSDIASDLVIEPCGLKDAASAAVKKFSVLFIYRKLSVTIGDLGAPVISDKKWLLFLMEQILSNAIKYTNTGGVSITRAGNTLKILDTGIGIRAEDLPRIFERGFTGYNGRIDSRATGLGLYLCRQTAQALSIRIRVESTLGRGTCVELIFPETDTQIFRS